MKFIWVFLGGGLGSIFRYMIGKLLNHSDFFMPLGTMTVNILGSFIIGFSMEYLLRHHYAAVFLFVTVGFLGGFTTFSSFSYEAMLFLKENNLGMFFVYTSTTFILGLMAVFFGYNLSKILFA